ncbi:ATP-binding protein [Dyadobacter sp. CY323]|uniref:tetratricopeptide repeat-containing sensor histidine kinase n=1 Tax=Dyadobacter sp. CY323 TaxID=2907302 RepID=UPI001F286391|nr:ATP-binding protein [Dyadobacter sp. CY323]MCE6991368.1 ATP-binding protein [Dyadobacter sp. CY323]
MKWLCVFMLLALCSNLFAQKKESAISISGSTKPDTNAVNELNQKGFDYWLEGNDSLAVIRSSQALNLAKKLGFLQGEAKARLHLTRIELDRFMDVKPAHAHLDTVLQIAKKLSDKSLEAKTYFRRAQFYEEVIENQAKVGPLLDKALQLYKEAGDKLGQALVYGEKAQILGGKGDYADAISLLLTARKIQEDLKDTTALRSTIPNLGVYYIAMGLYDDALKVFAESEIIAKKRNDTVLKEFLYKQRADIYEKKGQHQRALGQLQLAVDIHGSSAAPYRLARTYAKMGQNYLKLKDYVKGLKYTVLADKLYSESADVNEVMDHYVQSNYGKIYLAQKQYKKVISYAEDGLVWAMESDPPLLLEAAEYNRQLAEAYEKSGNAAKALYHLKQYKTQSDTLLNKESVQRITASAMTYEFDKKQQTAKLKIETLENDQLVQSRNFLIGLVILGFIITGFIVWSNRKLKSKNAELLAKNREIEEALFKGQKMERKRVASELHDNLNTKLAALRWRLEAMDTGKYEAFDRKIHQGSVEMLEDIYDDVRLISHSMLPVELETEGLLAALQKLVDKLNINAKTEFLLNFEGSYNRLPASMEHQLYIVTLELINNVIKHAQASKVWISFSQTGQAMVLTVSDNGVGMGDPAQSQGMGLSNLTSRVESLGGQMTVESAAGKGTTTVIRVAMGGE